MLSKWMYDVDDPSKLNDEQKSTLSAILSLGSSALGATLGNTTDAIASGMASSVAVEDNYLTIKQKAQWDKELLECKDTLECLKVRSRWFLISSEQNLAVFAGGAAALVGTTYEGAVGLGHLIMHPVDSKNCD